MSTLALMEGQVQPNKLADMESSTAQLFPEARGYDSCLGIAAQFNTDDLWDMILAEQ